MPSRFQTTKCAASDDCTTSQAWMLLPRSWAMRCEHALGAGALDAHGDAGIFRLERLADLFRQRQIDRGVVDDLALLLRGLDQRRRHRLGRRGGGADRLGEQRRRGQRGSRLEHVAPVECRFHALHSRSACCVKPRISCCSAPGCRPRSSRRRPASSFITLMSLNGLRPGILLRLRMHRAQRADVDDELLAFRREHVAVATAARRSDSARS